MTWVLDPSLALASVFSDEISERADVFLATLSTQQAAWVPTLWWYEVANALVMGIRRKRISEADGTRALHILASLPLQIDFSADANTTWRLMSLAREHELSAYDAAYLELAQRRGLALASLDRRLCAAAKAAGIRTL